jgi:hypothetical protein
LLLRTVITPWNSSPSPTVTSIIVTGALSRLRISATTSSGLAFSASTLLTTIMQGSFWLRAQLNTRSVIGCTPSRALTTSTAASTAPSARRVSARKLPSPGVSTMLTFFPFQVRYATLASSEQACSFSSTVSSRMLDLSSTFPSFGVAFATKSMASASDVLPEPLCPMRATFRMSAGAITLMATSYQSPPT